MTAPPACLCGHSFYDHLKVGDLRKCRLRCGCKRYMPKTEPTEDDWWKAIK